MTGEKRRTDALAEALALPILTQTLAEGQKMPSDAEICASHSVSRTVVREAFRILSGKGLIVARPRVGTLVAPRPTWALWDGDILQWLDNHNATGTSPYVDKWLADAMDIRLALEPSFAALAASRATPKANEALQLALRELQQVGTIAAEAAFLATLYDATDNDFAAYPQQLTGWSLRHRKTGAPLADYARVTAAIAQKDSATARQSALQALLGG
ncbi:MAG: FadR family transcriptional regulator [Rhodobiaceae bacterium]|jgi:GntR family galactonate operon transcriptional repressor|nr:FadR family transcriptional regulator [Rhodobiaceae bacterium]